MKGRIAFILLSLMLGAAMGHAAVLLTAPRSAMNSAIERIHASGLDFNEIRHAARVGPESRRVVRPAPDLAYSTCLFDVGEAPVRFRAPPPSGYLSLSLFAMNTDNFFVRNDQHRPNMPIDVVLMKSGMRVTDTLRAALPEATEFVEAPSERGIALFRTIVPTPEDWVRIDDERRRATCTSLASLISQ